MGSVRLGGLRDARDRRSDVGLAVVRIAGVQDLVLSRIAEIDHDSRPRLRFDKVAIGFVNELQSGLNDAVPDGKTVIVTITAPLRQATKTALELEDKIVPLLRRRSAATKLHEVIRENDIHVRVVSGVSNTAPKVVGFVHNPAPAAAQILLDIAASCVKAAPRSGRDKRR